MLGVGETVCDREFNATDKFGEALGVIVIVGESEMLGHAEELEPNVLEPDEVIDPLIGSDALPVIERGVTSVVGINVASGVGDGVKVDELLTLSVGEGVGVIVGCVIVGTALDVSLGLPPKEIVDGGVDDDDGDCEGLGLGVTVLVPVVLVVGVNESLEVPENDCDVDGDSITLAKVVVVA